MSTCLHSHPFVNSIAIECNEKDRSSKDDEVMQNNMAEWSFNAGVPHTHHQIHF